jgi:hypothetical protein
MKKICLIGFTLSALATPAAALTEQEQARRRLGRAVQVMALKLNPAQGP